MSSPHDSQNSPRAEDPADFNQRRRLKELADAQRTARESIFMATAGNGEVDEKVAFAAVKAFLQEIRWPMAQHGDQKYRTEELGAIEVPPPDALQRLTNRRTVSECRTDEGDLIEKVIGDSDIQPHNFKVVGLLPSPNDQNDALSFAELPPSFSGYWSLFVEIRDKGPDTREFTRDNPVPVPMEITERAFSMCNRFMNETGLDVRIDEKRPHNHMDWEE